MTSLNLHADSIEIAAEHCAWLIRNGVSVAEAKRQLGIVGSAREWRRVQAHVARRWLNLQMRKTQKAAA